MSQLLFKDRDLHRNYWGRFLVFQELHLIEESKTHIIISQYGKNHLCPNNPIDGR